MTEIVDWHSEVSEAVYHSPLLEKNGQVSSRGKVEKYVKW